MEIDLNNIENSLFDIFDQVKVLISQEIWENILLNSTKNELLVFMLLYRNSEVNMTQIADYLGAPLNTATGIVARMEKKDMVLRVRSTQDKRVVTIRLTEDGTKQTQAIMNAFMKYGQRIVAKLSMEELALISSLITKVITILQDEYNNDKTNKVQVRKIMID